MKFYFQNQYERKEKLLKYTESGDCDFPINVNIKGLKNLFSLKKHMDEEDYHKADVDIPFFELLESKASILKKQNFFQVILKTKYILENGKQNGRCLLLQKERYKR